MAYNYEYPYTDPYRYNDDWLLRKMKDLIDEWAAMQKQFADLQTAFNDLKNYVMNYFANLDVQEEVEVVLNKWLADGTIQTLVNNYLSPYKAPFSSTNVGALIIGNEYISDSKSPTGLSLGAYLLAQLGANPRIDLSSQGLSLMANGASSYYNVLSSWKSQHPDFFKEGYRILYVFIDRGSLEYSDASVKANLNNLRLLFDDYLRVCTLPYMYTNDGITSSNYQDYKLYLKQKSLDWRNYTIAMTFPPTRYGEAESSYFLPNQDILSVEGVLAYTFKLINCYLYHTYIPSYRSLTLIPPDSTDYYIIISMIDINETKCSMEIIFRWKAGLTGSFLTPFLNVRGQQFVVWDSEGRDLALSFSDQAYLSVSDSSKLSPTSSSGRTVVDFTLKVS